MWPFKRKKKTQSSSLTIPCSYCGSTNTRLIMNHGTDQPGYVKIWRGQRSVTCRCLDCGKDFYAEEPLGGSNIEDADERLIDDEDALHAAEEEVKRQIKEDNDRRSP